MTTISELSNGSPNQYAFVLVLTGLLSGDTPEERQALQERLLERFQSAIQDFREDVLLASAMLRAENLEEYMKAGLPNA